MENKKPRIFYTQVDEAPELSSVSLLPILKVFADAAGIEFVNKDISLSSRIIANFSDLLPEHLRKTDALEELGLLVQDPNTVIIKLPNISATKTQLNEAITELQNNGYPLPNYPFAPNNNQEIDFKKRYDNVIGSVVNPVLRKGNSLRIIPHAVKKEAQKNPHKMGSWSSQSKTHVAMMDKDDFRNTEKSIYLESTQSGNGHIEFISENGKVTLLKDNIVFSGEEFVDSAIMRRDKLREFIEAQLQEAKNDKILFSLHLKATMMVKTDGVIFGDTLKIYFKDVFDKYSKTFQSLNIDPNSGISEINEKIESLSDKSLIHQIKKDIKACYQKGAEIAMVDVSKNINNLDKPNHVIVDASMPSMIRWSGQMQDSKGNYKDTKAVIPDSTYAPIYQAAIDYFKSHSSLNPSSLGSLDNVGLMAEKAEEYGSKDKTFIAPGKGTIRLVINNKHALLEQKVNKGDIYRLSATSDKAVQNWIKLSLEHANKVNKEVVFWLDKQRPHDALLIKSLRNYILDHGSHGANVRILAPKDAMTYTLHKLSHGDNLVSATGNVLRDYLTDFFPIMEVGISAKMLSLIPLLNGGLVAETGSGGTAPKHLDQVINENHFRWNSLGEFLAISEAFKKISQDHHNKNADILSKTLNIAIEKYLVNNKQPSRTGIDTRESHYYLATYWAKALSNQTINKKLAQQFKQVAKQLKQEESNILSELKAKKGTHQELGGHYALDYQKASHVMRQSKTLNRILTLK